MIIIFLVCIFQLFVKGGISFKDTFRLMNTLAISDADDSTLYFVKNESPIDFLNHMSLIHQNIHTSIGYLIYDIYTYANKNFKIPICQRDTNNNFTLNNFIFGKFF